MSLTITTCKHSVADIEGERVCIYCGCVLGRVEVASIDDWKSHNIRPTTNKRLVSAGLKLCQNLNLPQFAFNTLISTASKLLEIGLSKKKALLYGTVYACRTHNIPRLLSDIYFELQTMFGKPKHESEKSILKLLNRISKKAFDRGIYIRPPDKSYYLQAYLAKIQNVLEQEASADYYETVRIRSTRSINKLSHEPSTSAKDAILQNLSSTFRPKVKEVLN
ncbi:MAG: hypothetical protein GWN01_03595 [Nitrosopumilaceae archaeon]|nr:hypothetical protein [Nitrosopumilaceae archaeon]NIU00042.1 hypothetical protein [Nitrosopumilaceae archaeon]NIU86421.1 hypothetical protein [Nitrosopumilaceae archaeon]NIV65130.1 hypothetical protein [Nitrosopumilaceae archaeon]NIX60644.1 hypothetical protein [Nitrosopumilaceae archaeon]